MPWVNSDDIQSTTVHHEINSVVCAQYVKVNMIGSNFTWKTSLVVNMIIMQWQSINIISSQPHSTELLETSQLCLYPAFIRDAALILLQCTITLATKQDQAFTYMRLAKILGNTVYIPRVYSYIPNYTYFNLYIQLILNSMIRVPTESIVVHHKLKDVITNFISYQVTFISYL